VTTPDGPRISLRLVAIAVAVLALAAIGCLAFIAMSTAQAAREVQASIARVSESARSFDLSAIEIDLASTRAAAADLNVHTSGFGWQLIEMLPVTGTTARAITQSGATTADLAAAALPLAATLQGDSSTMARLMGALGAQDELRALSTASRKAAESFAPYQSSQLLFGISEAIDQSVTALPALADALDAAASAAEPLQRMLGKDSPTTWLVMAQNPAEIRGSGGLFNAYLLVRFTNGQPEIIEAGSRKQLDGEFPRAEQIPYKDAIDAATANTWGPALGEWASFNLPGDFATVGQLAAAGMAKRGTPVDGVIAIDPTIVAAVLAGTGPVEHKGVTIDATTAVDFFTKGLYESYPGFDDVAAKDDLAMGLTYATVDSALTRPLDLAGLWGSMGEAISEGHLKVWSADPGIEQWLTTTTASGTLASRPDEIVIRLNNATGGKLDAYAATRFSTDFSRCASEGYVMATITIENQAPAGLPEYVDVTLDQDGVPDPNAPKGQTTNYVTAYPPAGWDLAVAYLNGSIVKPSDGRENGRRAWTIPVTVPRNAEGVLSLTLAADACPTGSAPTTASNR
jgi:hypothetical protein